MYELLLNTAPSAFAPWPTGLPGPQTLSKGNPQVGFFGEVSGTDFITYPELSSTVGLTTGNAMNPTGGWFKLAYKGNVQYISKLTVRNNVPWSTINSLGMVTATQNKLITIKGKTYRVRLISGANTDPWSGTNDQTGGPATIGSEWNKLMYGLMSQLLGPSELEGPALGTYSAGDLGLAPIGLLGTSILIKELAPGNISSVRTNGSGAIRGIYQYASITTSDSNRGWRPVVEYVSG